MLSPPPRVDPEPDASLVEFGEFGKNFIEIGKRPKVREAILRLRSKLREFAVEDPQCRSANWGKAFWKSRLSASAAWE